MDDTLHIFIPHFDYLLIDLSMYDNDRIKNEIFKRDSIRISMLIMKNILKQVISRKIY